MSEKMTANPHGAGEPPRPSAFPVSIIINNYNYGRYLAAAIDSALAQAYPDVEVLVVDDGSTDDSRAVIASYGDRIVAVLKQNGGQASACNAGLERCHGEACIFLDADDLLAPQIAAHVADAFREDPALATVQYRLAVIDAEGRPLGMTTPPAEDTLPNGDLRAQILRSGNYLSPPTSGNAFAMWALRQLFPVPEDRFRISADGYIIPLAALLGRVRSLEEIGGHYRIHGANQWFATTLDLDHLRRDILVQRDSYVEVGRFARAHDIVGRDKRASDLGTGEFLASRMISLKLEPRRHPIQGDSLLKLAFQSLAIPRNQSRHAFRAHVLRTVWFWSMVPAPRKLANRLAIRGLRRLRMFQVR